MKIRLLLAAACTLISTLALAQPTTSTSAPADKPIHLTILHINDPHGHLEPYTLAGRSVGGYARLSTLIQQTRAQTPDQPVFLVHAGDEFSKGDDLTTKTLGQANISVLNELGPSLWVPGNGEFYDGIANLSAAIRRANFPTLAANVLYKSTGKPIANEYVILQAGPVRVAFFGLCFVRPGKWADGLTLADPIETARQLVPKLRKQADLVVAVTHIGVDQDARLAQAVDGIDLIIGGHTHTTLDKGILVKNPSKREILITQAGGFLQQAGRIDLTLTPNPSGGYKLTSAQAKLIPLDDTIKLDPKITALIARLNQAASQPARQAPQPVNQD